MFFTYEQNNAHGFFYVNETVGHYVILERDTEFDADWDFREIASEYLEGCPCCGSRWWSEDTNSNIPTINGKDIFKLPEDSELLGDRVVIYYKSGAVINLELKANMGGYRNNEK